MSAIKVPRVYVIDVCATCGRPATWPFCEHRRSDRPWTIPLRAVLTPASRRQLAEAMGENQR